LIQGENSLAVDKEEDAGIFMILGKSLLGEKFVWVGGGWF
jgi:hypothetical protein